MLPREKKNNAYAKFWGTNKEYYGILRTGLFVILRQTGRPDYYFSFSSLNFLDGCSVISMVNNLESSRNDSDGEHSFFFFFR